MPLRLWAQEAVESTIVRGLVLEADAAKPEPAANTTPSSAKATKSRFGETPPVSLCLHCFRA